MKKSTKKVFVAMSGGVDSSVAALLLKRQGYDVVGVFMKCWTPPSAQTYADLNADLRGNECGWERDAEDARRVAEKIGIPFYAWDFEAEYKKKVVDYMVHGYKRGETPNPDVMCNREIKFGLFLERALKMGADYVATGHYVKLAKSKSQMASSKKPFAIGYKLFAARDAQKDQSYFLWTLTQKQLAHCLFPIGGYLKSEVRVIARQAGLLTAEKKDSQGICFLGKVTLADFLKRYIPEKRGAVLNLAGQKVGEHQGAHFYTIGQRQGIGSLKHQKGVHSHKPLYVAGKNVRRNEVVMAEGADNPALCRKEIALEDVNIINPQHTNKLEYVGMSVLGRVRYRQPLVEARTMNYESRVRGRPTIRNSKFLILKFDQPVKFVAPGQSAVFYSKTGEMLGGGVICK